MAAADHIVGNATDTGREREINQDYFGFFESTPYGAVWVVCDGMGGAAGGEVASTIAVEAVKDTFQRTGFTSANEAIRYALETANSEVFERAEREPAGD